MRKTKDINEHTPEKEIVQIPPVSARTAKTSGRAKSAAPASGFRTSGTSKKKTAQTGKSGQAERKAHNERGKGTRAGNANEPAADKKETSRVAFYASYPPTRRPKYEPHKVSPDDEQVAELYEQGLSYSQIEQKLHAYYGFAGYHVRRYERLTGTTLVRGRHSFLVGNPKRPITQEEEETIQGLVDRHCSIAGIAAVTGFSVSMVRKYLNHKGLMYTLLENRQKDKDEPVNAKKDEVYELRRQGLTQIEIAEKTGLSRYYVRNILNDEIGSSIPQLRSPVTDFERREVLLLRACDLTLAEIGDKTGRSKSLISKTLSKFTPEQKRTLQEIKDMLQAGKSVSDIASALHLNNEEKKILKDTLAEQQKKKKAESGLRTRLTKEEAEIARVLYDNDKSITEISRLMKRHRSTIARLLKIDENGEKNGSSV